MLDTVIRGATVVDGSGGAPFTGDVGLKDGLIAQVGGKLGAARREIDAAGALVTPGWVDVHTHYDGQATWDPYLSPSTQHGVTTAVMGNCGVGFAPVKPERRDWLISVMEGVEDIPGTVLSEGIRWDWESFPQYLDALAAKPRALDVGAQVPHSAVRTYVMGERGITHDEATADDIRAMTQIVAEGLRAGALGFSTSRTLIHKYQQHKYPPGTFASPEEILGIARSIKAAGHGVFQMTANHVGMEGELWWLTQIARDNQLPVAFALVQTDQTPDTWKRLLAHLDGTHAQGVPLYGSVSGRATSMVMGFQGSLHPFVLHPLWQQLAPLPWDAKLARLREPEVRAALTRMEVVQMAAQVSQEAALFLRGLPRLFVLHDAVDYEPPLSDSVVVIGQATGRNPLEVAYDAMLGNDGRDDGKGLLYFPVFNYAYGDLSQLHTQLQHPRTLISLADGGAHVGYICDVSMPTFMLTHWARDRARGPTLPLAQVVKKQTRDTAQVYGLHDRGLLAPGLKADLNIIDFERLALDLPHFVFDLPAGGRRLTQGAEGYLATLVNGEVTLENGQPTGALPGQLVRGPQSAPA
ncbi:N-acyl-D-amino-acid deacylase family protein [Variovorax terrae]|uniref:Amidohydrolase family protein n=1 Tax=Variovorax terrae TaxID=2923278 RepID=A0A9X1W4C4_9BURK|nr:amidohydrolase family protein [Variovorax terrae]MCJ0765593.1 amidohydrolase family protein [Variovorax terrae]